MASWTELLLALSLAGCAEASVEVLLDEVTFQGDEATYTCSDGTKVVTNKGRDCLGISFCSGSAPDSVDCEIASNNPLFGTCVQTFFSCFQPAGKCTEDESGNATFPNGARRTGSFGSGDQALYPPNSDTPCIRSVKTGYGSPEARTWIRPLD